MNKNVDIWQCRGIATGADLLLLNVTIEVVMKFLPRVADHIKLRTSFEQEKWQLPRINHLLKMHYSSTGTLLTIFDMQSLK
jgi:hypothetical protein